MTVYRYLEKKGIDSGRALALATAFSLALRNKGKGTDLYMAGYLSAIITTSYGIDYAIVKRYTRIIEKIQ